MGKTLGRLLERIPAHHKIRHQEKEQILPCLPVRILFDYYRSNKKHRRSRNLDYTPFGAFLFVMMVVLVLMMVLMAMFTSLFVMVMMIFVYHSVLLYFLMQRYPAFSATGLQTENFFIFAKVELFYAYEADGKTCLLDADESAHCIKVLRHRAGDEIDVIDGNGTLYHCRITLDNPKGAEALVLESMADWHAHPYRLTIGCCPTKNNDRFEWFVEKATEIGVDCIAPLIGDRSERKVYKTERAERIALSATKQSLKARIPQISQPISVKDFITEPREGLKLIAYCFEDETVPRISICKALEQFDGAEITVLIGPEGDFSAEEAQLALTNHYIPVHLGASRLRTETAAVTAAQAVYLKHLDL